MLKPDGWPDGRAGVMRRARTGLPATITPLF